MLSGQLSFLPCHTQALPAPSAREARRELILGRDSFQEKSRISCPWWGRGSAKDFIPLLFDPRTAQESQRNDCPLCRWEIQGTEQVEEAFRIPSLPSSLECQPGIRRPPPPPPPKAQAAPGSLPAAAFLSKEPGSPEAEVGPGWTRLFTWGCAVIRRGEEIAEGAAGGLGEGYDGRGRCWGCVLGGGLGQRVPE